MAAIEFREVTKRFQRESLALDDLSLSVEEGEFLILVGPSGCGKTTALRLTAGLEEVTSGEIRIGARVVNDVRPADRDIAMVFQNYALYPHMTVRDNIGFPLGAGGRHEEWPRDQPDRPDDANRCRLGCLEARERTVRQCDHLL